MPCSSCTAVAISWIRPRTMSSSRTEATSGIMISGSALPPALSRAAAASRIARACMVNRWGIAMPRRTPRRPSIGFCSCSRWTAASSLRSRFLRWPRESAMASLTESSVRSGRNSWSGGSMSRIVTGSPSIASKIRVKSSRWSGSSSARAASCPASSSATIRFSTSWRRSPRNMCSVRHRPMPWAPKRRARAASSAVSAFVRTFIRRAASACSISRATACDERLVDLLALEVAHHRRRGDRDGPEEHLAGRPVDRDHVALADRRAAADDEGSLARVHVERLGAADAGAAHAARDHGRVRGLAARGW